MDTQFNEVLPQWIDNIVAQNGEYTLENKNFLVYNFGLQFLYMFERLWHPDRSAFFLKQFLNSNSI